MLALVFGIFSHSYFYVHKFKDCPLNLNFNKIFTLNVAQPPNHLEEKYSIFLFLFIDYHFVSNFRHHTEFGFGYIVVKQCKIKVLNLLKFTLKWKCRKVVKKSNSAS